MTPIERVERGRGNYAVVSLVSGMVSVFTLFSFWFIPPLNFVLSGAATVVAVVAGIKALRETRLKYLSATTKAFAAIGIFTGLLSPAIVFLAIAIEGPGPAQPIGGVGDADPPHHYKYLEEIDTDSPAPAQPWQYPHPPENEQ